MTPISRFTTRLGAVLLTLQLVNMAARAETPLPLILGPDYVLQSNLDVTKIGARRGDVLTFDILGEATGWASSQTFSVVDGGVVFDIFAGSATTGATASHVLQHSFDGIVFDSHSGDPAQFAPGGATADAWLLAKGQAPSAQYALAYEDDNVGVTNDHNDMVIGFTVTPSVPEGSTWALVFAGLGLLVIRARQHGWTAAA